ncbi:hypothetical protein [Algoriphagus winogradskyi]|uniref:AAA+ ATPase domain-containing protein n=1 Tax=Algoriphagus winogradskyi TaxID=237017 RepID=A0ABY1P4W6_9BACT|nr:hypothetical protein [Algoriphagus winogradskyi]SMP26471.1 hypothetical protein SAMN06265367_104366 [Algoriphagus winogradskyi]
MSGRGTSAGVLFQAEVGAYAAALLITERPLSRLGDNLPGKPLKIFMESPTAVDDVNVITNKGLVYFQAKTSLSLSDNPQSELGSVVDQFVRQYREGVHDGYKAREMDVSRDRLVLVVSENAPATVRNDLREALIRNRTGAATALPANLKNALDRFEKLIASVWFREEGTVIISAKSQEILKLCSVAVLDSNQKQIVTDALREVVKVSGDESVLFKLLSQWAVEASQNGTGGQRDAIMRFLQGQISMKEPPSFQSDVAKLTGYSKKVLIRLERFTKIKTEKGEVSFSRPVSSVVLAAAKTGSLAITGDPGSGKSGIIHDLSIELSKDALVVTLTVESNISDLDVLKNEIGLEHSVIEVLKNIPLDTKGYLILDALDATRGGIAESTYKKLIEEVSLLPNWLVIASVRTFDLKLGLEWKRLFKGTIPNPVFSEPSFRTVRHVHVPLLGEAEINELEAKSPTLKIALTAGGTKMANLAKNPFNLSLIGELISEGLPPKSLSKVETRSELLSKYWEERMGDLGLPGTVAFKKYLDLILNERSVDIPETEIPIDASTIIQEVLARGILVTEQTRRIAFRHHILFDFAVSRLILEPSVPKAISRLSKIEGAGLLIAPSLEYWLEHLKHSQPALEYWMIVGSLISSDQTDPVIRVEVARIAVQGIIRGDDLSELAKVLSRPELEYKKAIIQIAGALSTYGINEETSETWSKMISGITDITEPYQLQSLKVITHLLINSRLSPIAIEAVGKVSRALFDEISKDDRLVQWLSSSIIPFVAKTYKTDPEGSKQRLDQIFADDRFKKFGYFEVPALADQVGNLAALDNELVAKIYRRVYAGGEFSADHTTTMGSPSWILGLNSNAAQDFQMAEYVLRSGYLKLLNQSPIAGIRALGAAIDAKERSWHTDPDVEYPVSYRDGKRAFKDDNFGFLYWEDDFDSDRDENICQIFQNWAETADESLLKEIPDILLGETAKSLAWRLLLKIGAKRAEVLGRIMWNSAIDILLVSSMNNQRDAIELIVATYLFVSEADRRDAEAKILAYDFDHTVIPEYYSKQTVFSVFSAIGESNLVSSEARNYLKMATEEKTNVIESELTEKDPLFVSQPNKETKIAGTTSDMEIISGLSGAIRAMLNEKPDIEDADLFWETVDKLSVLIDAQVSERFEELAPEIAGTYAKALGKALEAGWVPDQRLEEVISRLITLSKHSTPKTYEQTEVDFERFPAWSGNSVRVEIAEVIGSLIKVPALWPKIKDCYLELVFSDPHPAVRMQAIIRLRGLWDTDRNALWEIAGKFVDLENNRSVLGYGASELAFLRSAAVEQIEPLFLKLAEKKVSELGSKTDVSSTISYFALVKGCPDSIAVLNKWKSEFKNNEIPILNALFSLREYFAVGYATGQEQYVLVRKNVISFLWELIEELEPFIANWPTDRVATAEEISALKLFTAIGQQLYYAVGYREGVFLSLEQKKVFLNEYGPLISKLNTLGSPKTVHDCLQILEKFIVADPEKCFDLISEAMLRKSGVSKYEYEPMGAMLFVKLVGLFLADYRYIFTDTIRRNQLIECLAVFVDAGWPDARRLFKSLPDLK